ncbi:MAG: dTDP-4-dehydrorhamnose reductase [Fusobacterium sp.]|uniref:dTDP-4-dehydrorhamnose reductase n=1 Tax=Fusobacterium sp. TaxID=68766 RepID=UPI0026DB4BAF|nr:dTDP-4-dehydrorhamnose reductase [Fusobacterium sp.]MDO4690974.1 dTDP-4-dehydrorhamnose reductase [Fusobacterium sp.]
MILLLGAEGQLGKGFKKLFTKLNLEFIAIDINELDITKKEIAKKYILDTHKFKNISTIVNCAGYNDVDKAKEEKEKCFKVNMEAAVNLALVAMEIGANYFTYSTDHIFNGQVEDYLYNNNLGFSETDEPTPLSNFAQSKYEAEVLVNQAIQNISTGSKVYIVRASWVFGESINNFIEKIIRSSKEHDEIFVVDDQISSPTYAADLAEFSWKLLKNNSNSGIYHFTNDGIVSKYDFAKYILEKLSWQGKLIPIKTTDIPSIAKRPSFSKLNCKKIKETLSEGIPHWKDAVDRYFKEIHQ